MRPCRIQLSGVIPALLILLLSGAASLMPTRCFAQGCTGTLGTITYNTTFIADTASPGVLSGKYNYLLPQFPISSLTLYAVTLKSTISVNAEVTIFNSSSTTPITPSVQVFRSDAFTSPAVNFSGSVVSPNPAVVAPTLAPFTLQTVPIPDLVSNSTILNDSVTDLPSLNAFTGPGNLPFTYTTNDVGLPSAGSPINIHVKDTMHFSITYFYCDPGPLAVNYLTFTANRKNDQTVELDWTTTNEQAGRNYTVETSNDGKTFVYAGSLFSDPVNSQASYSYNYSIPSSASGKIYFRLKVVNENGISGYSEIRAIDLGAGGEKRFSIYPNPPSDFIQLTLPATSKVWQVDILAADGSLVQRNVYPNTDQARVNFARKLSAGAYFARATDTQTAKSYVAPFVIR
jgi:hypothetical protein